LVVGEVGAYGQDLSARLRASLGDQLVGAYFVGPIALGGYVPGESDIDIIAVSEHHVSERLKGWSR
jgi:predicted nucleotidyltransferase